MGLRGVGSSGASTLTNLASGGGGGGIFSALGALGGPLSFLSGPWGAVLGGLGSIFGNNKSMEYYEQGRNDILDLPGMSGPSNLSGLFGASVGGNFSSDPYSMAMQSALGGVAPGLLTGQFGSQDLTNALGALQIAPAAAGVNSALQQQIGPMNADLAAISPALLGGGMLNLAAAGNSDALQAQELDIMRQQFAPERQRMENSMFNRMHAMGLLGPNTDVESASSLVRGTQDAIANADLGFQRESFSRGMQRQGFLGNLGLEQIGQGVGAVGQAFTQGLQALGANQQSALGRLQSALGLFTTEQDAFTNQFGLGLQGVEGMLGLNQFGLDAAAMPFQLQAALLSGGGQHADALQQIARAQAKASSGFFGSLFSDRRLKTNIKRIGTVNGYPWYSFDYIWGQSSEGVMSDEVPDEFVTQFGGYDVVDYTRIL